MHELDAFRFITWNLLWIAWFGSRYFLSDSIVDMKNPFTEL